jgi:hypothetical protein
MELNTVTWLSRLRETQGARLSLDRIPEETWKSFRSEGMDFIWLMGVWKRSPRGRRMALKEPNLHRAFDLLRPGWKPEDVAGSAYAVTGYEVNPYLGGRSCLKRLHRRVRKAGLKLILDFIPNHFALDHPWTLSRPARFVGASPRRAAAHPEWFFQTGKGKLLAHGRDPYFAPWCDTVQINYFSPQTRKAMIDELLRIAEVSDGVRCDMAMLILNEVFGRVWGEYAKPPEGLSEFWQEAIAAVKSRHPGFIFLGEVYWDLEWRLQQLGFDYTYDKRLYDRLLHNPARDVRSHLMAEAAYQTRSARFVENHDEDRSLAVFGTTRAQAAAVISSTVPGMAFFYDGQQAGKKLRAPVHLRAEREEPRDPEVAYFYQKLFRFIDSDLLRYGQWKLLEVLSTSPENNTHENLLAWGWRRNGDWKLVVVNYSGVTSQGKVIVPASWLRGCGGVKLLDRASGLVFERSAEDIARGGLYIELGPWKSHWFDRG